MQTTQALFAGGEIAARAGEAEKAFSTPGKQVRGKCGKLPPHAIRGGALPAFRARAGLVQATRLGGRRRRGNSLVLGAHGGVSHHGPCDVYAATTGCVSDKTEGCPSAEAALAVDASSSARAISNGELAVTETTLVSEASWWWCASSSWK